MSYKNGYVLDYGLSEVKRTRINCKDCVNYISEDYSCSVTSFFFPEDGYNKWKNCDHFELNDKTYNYEKKKAKVDNTVKMSEVEDALYIQAYQTIPAGKSVRLTMDSVFLEYRECIRGANIGSKNEIKELARIFPENTYRGYLDYLKYGNKSLLKAAIVEWVKRLGIIPYNRAISRVIRKSKWYLFPNNRIILEDINREKIYNCIVKSLCDELFGELDAFVK